MIWACFLHFYQPPTQKKYWIDRITDESYRRIIKGLLENPTAKITLNINSILCELWEECGHTDVLDGLKALVERGQVELTGSAKFHPLLPKLPKEMVVRQILLNEITLNKYFGVVGPATRNLKFEILNLKSNSNDSNVSNIENCDNSNSIQNSNCKLKIPMLRGFFPPEMAYNRYLAQIVADLGYEWIIAEELSLGKPVDYSKIYSVEGLTLKGSDPKSGLKIFFRDRAFSYKILAGYLGTEKLFVDELKVRFPLSYKEIQDSNVKGDSGIAHAPQNDVILASDEGARPESVSDLYLLTAMDGETFGHHRPGMERLLFDLFKIPEIQMVHISDLPRLFPKRESVETKPSTWALMEHEIELNLPFARWDDPENEVHKLQWELTDLAIETVKDFSLRHPDPAQPEKDLNSRDSSGRTPQNDENDAQNLLDRALHSDQYWWASAKPWWSIEYIERGAKELLEAVRAAGNRSAEQKAQELYYKILETAFEYQRSGKVDEISKKEDETIRMRTDQGLPKMPKEELLKIIETIRAEMLTVAQNQEYERAAQLRDRIKELKTYLN